jgi:hypothetical protein
MAHDRPGPDRDRLLVARLDGIAKRHAHWREPTESEIGAALAELREVAGERPDLLAEVAGIFLGASEGRLDEPRARAAAQLCIAAGADKSMIPEWIAEGKRRAEAAKRPPSSGGVRPLDPPGRCADHGSATDPSRYPGTAHNGRQGEGKRGGYVICTSTGAWHLDRLHDRRLPDRQEKGPGRRGLALTFFLGLIGLLILAFLTRTKTVKAEEAGTAGYAYSPQEAYQPYQPHPAPGQGSYPQQPYAPYPVQDQGPYPQPHPGQWQQPPWEQQPPATWPGPQQ